MNFVTTLFSQLGQVFNAQTAARKLILLAVVMGSVVGMVMLTLYAQSGGYQVIYSNLTTKEAAHYLAAARSLLTYHATLALTTPNRLVDCLGQRDAMMADNLVYIHARERARAPQSGKVLAHAHNSHLKRGQAQWQLGPQSLAWWPAGSHIAHILGPRYAVVGAALGVSEANAISPPEDGTLEALLTTTSGPARFIPTHLGQSLPPEAIAALPIRTASTKNYSYFPLTAQSFTDFDWLAVLDSTPYTRGARPLP